MRIKRLSVIYCEIALQNLQLVERQRIGGRVKLEAKSALSLESSQQ